MGIRRFDWDNILYRNDRNDLVNTLVGRLLLARTHGGLLLVLLLVVLGLEEEGVCDLNFTIIGLVGLLSVLSLLPTIQGVTNPHHRGAFIYHPFIWLV